jgi:hypothetical protein
LLGSYTVISGTIEFIFNFRIFFGCSSETESCFSFWLGNYTVISRTMPISTTPVRRERRLSSPPAICRTCKEAFSSRNALFYHLGKTLHYLRSAIKSVLHPIVASKAQRRKVGTGTAFKDFNYCEVRYQLSPRSPDSESWGCADTGSGMSLVDESVLESGALPSRKRTVKSPVHIKGIGDEMYLSKESVVLDVFFPDVTNTRLAKITREFHIVQDMDCGLLIGNDIIEPEGIVIDAAKKRMHITSCDKMACQLRVRRKKLAERLPIRCAQSTTLPASYLGSYTPVRIRFPKPELGKRYAFKVYCDSGFFPRCVFRLPDLNTCKVEDVDEFTIVNCSKNDIHIPKDFKFGYFELSPEPSNRTAFPLFEHSKRSGDNIAKLSCYFRKAVEPQRSRTVINEVATVPISTTSSRRVPKKTPSLCESAPKMSPQSARSPPSCLRSSVPSPPSVPSFLSSSVRSFLPPLRRSPFFFYRPQYFSFSCLPPSTTNQGFNSPLGFYSYPFCRRPSSFPPKPGLQLLPPVKLFTCATNC